MTKIKNPAQDQDIEKNKEQNKKMQTVIAKNQELENHLKRALADYHNLERRIDQERKLLGQLSSAILIEKFLPVLDNLENAQKHLNDEGLEMVIKQFKDVFAQEGVEEILSEGSHFDPKFHEAVEVAEGPDEGRIVKVLIKGYKIDGRVLRPAKVIVTKSKIDQSVKEKADLMSNA